MDKKEKNKILKLRAKLLSQPYESKIIKGERLNGIKFKLAEEEYILDNSFTQGVIELHEFSPIPCTPDFIVGVTYVKGRLLSIIDLKRILNLPQKGITNMNRVIIVSTDEIEFGILTDDITGYGDFILDDFQSVMSTSTISESKFISGVTKDRLILLDIEKLLKSNDIIINDKIN